MQEERASDLRLEELVDLEHRKNIIQIPLEFDYEPVDLLSKELTKLHSTSQYRIVYLGPRWPQSLKLHKSMAATEAAPCLSNPHCYGCSRIERYSLDLNRAVKSSMFGESVYKNEYYKTAIYYRAFEGMNPTITPNTELVFDSQFESANLDCVVKVSDREYDLFLRVDSNTRGHTLWYYFAIRNGRQRRSVQLNICNISKHRNLYMKVHARIYQEQGMKPFVFSQQKHLRTGTAWQQETSNVTFGQAKLRYEFLYERCKVRPFSRLSFEYEFEYENDQVFFAYCIPYTYSYLLKELKELPQKDQQGNQILDQSENGRTLMGLPLPILKITNTSIADHDKKIIMVTGRIHPGETNGSIVLSALLKYLCSNEAHQLRRHALFIIVPMMNPDGVVMGNYRTGAAGKDLNRVYTRINKQVYPEIYHMRLLMDRLTQNRQVYMFLDFHGHSDKKNTFVYGPVYNIAQPEYYKSKILPKMLSTKTPIFRYYACVFRLAQSKKETARAVMLEQYKIPFAYTVESSNGSYYDGEAKQTFDFNMERWMDMGNSMGQCLSEYICMVEEYEQFVAQRREGHSRKRPKRLVSTSHGVRTTKHQEKQQLRATEWQEEAVEEVKPPTTTVFFLNMIEEIRNEDKCKKNEDSDIDSDSNDDQEDLEPEKLAEFNKILIKDYKTNEVVDTFNPKLLRKKEGLAKPIRNRAKDPTLKKTRDELEFEMDLLNDMCDRLVATQERKRILSPNKDRRVRANQREFLEKSQDIKEESQRRQASSIDDRRLTMDVPPTNPSEIKIKDNLIQLNLSDLGHNPDQRVQSSSKTSQVCNGSRYSVTKIKRDLQSRNNDTPGSSFFNFEVNQPMNSIFALPAHHLRAFTRQSRRKKKSLPLAQAPPDGTRVFSSYGNTRQNSRKNLRDDEPLIRQGPLEFNFTKLLKQTANQPPQKIQEDARLRDYRSLKTVFPSSFYRIKQQLRSRRNPYQWSVDDQEQNASLNIRRVGM